MPRLLLAAAVNSTHPGGRRRARPSRRIKWIDGAGYPLADLDHGAGAVNPSTIATAELLKRFRISATSWYSGEW